MTKSKHTPTTKKGTGPLFHPGKARWLQEKSAELDADQQALLLALAQLEAELGRELSEEETVALKVLAAQMDSFSSNKIIAAVREMVATPADPKRQTSWPELKRHKS